MKRLTRDPKLAMERLADRLGVQIHKDGKLYFLRGMPTRRRTDTHPSRNAKRCLARMITIAQFMKQSGGWGMARDEIRDTIRLRSITSHGTVAHEEEAIRLVLS